MINQLIVISYNNNKDKFYNLKLIMLTINNNKIYLYLDNNN